jgi:hypothetical protein
MYRPIHFPRFAFTRPSILAAGHRWRRWVLFGLMVAAALAYELKTSTVQARLLAYYASRLSYELVPGVSRRIAFPVSGPFDQRRGYSSLPVFLERTTGHGYRISHQAELSPELARLIQWGVSPPYREPAMTGLTIRGRRATVLYDATRPERYFRDFGEIPPLLIKTLLFIENRELHEDDESRTNPVIEWDRLLKASVAYAGHNLGFLFRCKAAAPWRHNWRSFAILRMDAPTRWPTKGGKFWLQA